MLSMLHPAEDRWILKMFVWDQRIVGPIRLVAGCRKRWLNQAVSLSVLYLVLGFFWVCFFFAETSLAVFVYVFPRFVCRLFCLVVVNAGVFKWLTGKTRLRSDP